MGVVAVLVACAPQPASPKAEPAPPPPAPAAPSRAEAPPPADAAPDRDAAASAAPPAGVWRDATWVAAGEVSIAGDTHRMRIDPELDEAVRYGSARFWVHNRGERPHRLRARTVMLAHPDGCRAPARNRRTEMRVQDVYRVEPNDSILGPREVTLAPGEQAVLEIVFGAAQAHPKTCPRTLIEVHFVLDGNGEVVGVAEWMVERR